MHPMQTHNERLHIKWETKKGKLHATISRKISALIIYLYIYLFFFFHFRFFVFGKVHIKLSTSYKWKLIDYVLDTLYPLSSHAFSSSNAAWTYTPFFFLYFAQFLFLLFICQRVNNNNYLNEGLILSFRFVRVATVIYLFI